MSLIILKRADKKRYGTLQESLANSFLIGRDEYPTTIGAVLKLLNNYKDSSKNRGGASFLQASTATASTATASTGGLSTHVRGTNNSFYPTATCRTCRTKGHYHTHCPLASSVEPEKKVRRTSADHRGPEHAEQHRSHRLPQANATGQEVSIHRSGIFLN